VKIRTRIIVSFALVVVVAFTFLVRWIREDLTRRYLEAVEESMVDLATILAGIVSRDLEAGGGSPDRIRDGLAAGLGRRFSAQVYDLVKTQVDVRVYLTDARGIVVFDSEDGRAEGEDYSRWNDVYLTLRGEYGSRASRADPDDPTSLTLYIAAPVLAADRITGVLTVCKPITSVNLFLRDARRQVLIAGTFAGAVVVLLGVAATAWITRPMDRLTAYAEAVRAGRRASLPELGRSEVRAMGEAMEGMRVALEGKEYVERYVQTLTHELKAPLTAIRGAVELLQEPDLPPGRRERFLHHVRAESDRLQRIVDRQLLLSSLERRQELRGTERIDLPELVREVVAGLGPVLSTRRVSVDTELPGRIEILGERFLLRHAVVNILQNAVDFSPPGGRIHLALTAGDGQVALVCRDNGPGVPAYALDRIFERFYSLPHPETGAKGSGLGLPFVREVAALHGGDVRLTNRPEGGVDVVLRLATRPPPGTAASP
jgi:two-component system sensor histidine kinase CreC